jgi:hypothetical protein
MEDENTAAKSAMAAAESMSELLSFAETGGDLETAMKLAMAPFVQLYADSVKDSGMATAEIESSLKQTEEEMRRESTDENLIQLTLTEMRNAVGVK